MGPGPGSLFVGSWEANVVKQTRTCSRTEKEGPKLSNRVDPNTYKMWGAVVVRTLQSTVLESEYIYSCEQSPRVQRLLSLRWGGLSCSSVRAGIPNRLEFQGRNGRASTVKGSSQGRVLPFAASLYRLPAEGVVKSLPSYRLPPTSNQAPPPKSLTGVPSIPGSLFIPG